MNQSENIEIEISEDVDNCYRYDDDICRYDNSIKTKK